MEFCSHPDRYFLSFPRYRFFLYSFKTTPQVACEYSRHSFAPAFSHVVAGANERRLYSQAKPQGGGLTFYSGLHGEAPPEKGASFGQILCVQSIEKSRENCYLGF